MRQASALRRCGTWLALAVGLISTKAGAEACTTAGPIPLGAVLASWYGHEHHGRVAAGGERFDEQLLTAAHPWLPFETRIRVVNLLNGRIVQVRITDRGPGHGRGIDLSQAAARLLGMEHCGLAPVRLLLGAF